MRLIKIIEELESQVEQSSRIPMTGKVLIEEEVLLDYLDSMRANIPEEIKQAQWVTKERERILSDAQAEAERIVMKAKSFVNEQASENEIVKAAEHNAQKILNNAKEEAEQISNHAQSYALVILEKLETTLNKATLAVQEGQNQVSRKNEDQK